MRSIVCALALSAVVGFVVPVQAGGFAGPCNPAANGGADWCDDFESYPTGNLHGVNRWQGWGPGSGDASVAGDVSIAQNRTAGGSQSVQIASNDDLVRVFSDYTDVNADFYTLTSYVFVPNNSSGEMFWIVLNQYDGGGAATNWSLQLNMDTDAGIVTNEGENQSELPLIMGDWVEIRSEINMVTNAHLVFYGGNLLAATSWTEGSSGGGILDIQAIDLFSNGSSQFFYDDISLFGGEIPEVIPPSVACQLATVTEEGCGDFLFEVENLNLTAPISTFYLDVEAGTGGAICTEDNIDPPAGFTVENCTQWVDGHAMFRLTGPAFLPGERVSGRIVVDTNGSEATDVPAFSVVLTVAQDQVDAVCAAGDFSFGPTGTGDWGSITSTCTAFSPVPAMSQTAKLALMTVLLAGGALLVIRSRRPVAA